MTSVILTALLASCIPPLGRPSQGEHKLDVPYHAQIQWNYCVPATILMWLDYIDPNSYNDQFEHQIWNYAVGRNWTDSSQTGVIGGNIAPLAQLFLNFPVLYNDYYGADAKLQAIADENKNVNIGDPTIVSTNAGTHVAIFIGASWQEISLARPSVDYVIIRDPDGNSHGQMERPSILSYINYATGCFGACAATWSRTPRLHALEEWNEFNNEGGTYYGDPNPPQPGRWKDDGAGGCYWDPNDFGANQCQGGGGTGRWKYDGNGGCYWDPNDSGPDQCVPPSTSVQSFSVLDRLALFAQLMMRSDAVRVATRGPVVEGRNKSRTYVHPPRSAIDQAPRPSTAPPKPPFPHPVTPSEILSDIVFGIKAMHMDRVEGYDRFEKRTFNLRRILDVQAETVGDYYVVELDYPNGKPFADVILGKDGLVGNVGDVRGGRGRSAQDLQDTERKLTAKFGNVTHLHFYFAPNNIQGPGGSPWVPMIVADTPAGRLILNYRNEVFVEEQLTPYKDREADTYMMGQKRPGEQWLLKREGIGKLKKIDDLKE